VIDVNLENAAPKLVIEAAINWRKGTAGNQQKNKTNYYLFYSTEIPKVSGATVSIKSQYCF
jgi:hypothetical protein